MNHLEICAMTNKLGGCFINILVFLLTDCFQLLLHNISFSITDIIVTYFQLNTFRVCRMRCDKFFCHYSDWPPAICETWCDGVPYARQISTYHLVRFPVIGWPYYSLKLPWILGELLSTCSLPLEIGYNLCSKPHEMNRPVCFEAHNYLLAHLSH